MTDVAVVPREVSNSEMRVFQRCPRQWALTYHWRYQTRPEGVAPLGKAQLGGNIHLALEAWYHHGLDPLAVLRWVYAELARERPAFEPDLRKELSLGLAMLEGFLAWTSAEGIDADLRVVAVERVLRVPVQTRLGTVILRGKLDQVVQRVGDGALLVRDWKTVDSLAKANSLLLDQQMRFYALLLSLLYRGTGQRVDGALYVMLRRVKRTIRANPPFYGQVHVSYNRHDLNATYARVTEVAARILEAHAALDAGADHHAVAYPNPTDMCAWACPFYLACPLLDDGSRAWDLLNAQYVQGDPYYYHDDDRINRVVEALGDRNIP